MSNSSNLHRLYFCWHSHGNTIDIAFFVQGPLSWGIKVINALMMHYHTVGAAVANRQLAATKSWLAYVQTARTYRSTYLPTPGVSRNWCSKFITTPSEAPNVPPSFLPSFIHSMAAASQYPFEVGRRIEARINRTAAGARALARSEELRQQQELTPCSLVDRESE